MTWAGESSASGVYIFTEDGSPGIAVGNIGDVLVFGQTSPIPEFIPQGSLSGVPGTGVISDGTSTNNRIVRWDGTTGKVVQNSDALLKDDGSLLVRVDGANYSSVYALSVQRDNPFSYIEILNASGSDVGTFFGTESNGPNLADQHFALYNWQGGPITFYTETSPSDGTLRFVIKNDGVIQVTNFSASGVVLNDAQGNLFTSSVLPNAAVQQSNVTQHEAALNHDALLNFVADEHIAHSSVNIIAGSGLQGGGTIDASRTFDLDIDGLPLEAAPDVVNDFVAIFDSSTGLHKKSQISDIAGTGDVTAALDLMSNRVVIGDDGAKGVKTSNVIISDEDETFFPGRVLVDSGNFSFEVSPADTLVQISGATGFNDPVMVVYGSTLIADGSAIQANDAQQGYLLTLRRDTPGSGIYIAAGDDEGDIALKITDEDMTFDILEVHTDNGQFVFGDTYANTLLTKGTAHAIDIQYASDSNPDINNQNGGYRLRSSGLIIDNDGNINTFATTEMSGTINGRRDFGENFGPLDSSFAFNAGDKYYDSSIEEEMRYDGTRSKWLSITRQMEGAGRNGTTSAGAFYRRWNGMIESTTLGALVPKGTLVYMSYVAGTSVAGTLECLVGGAVVATLDHTGTTASGNFNADFDGGVMSFRNQAGGLTTTNVQIVAHYKLRP